VEAMSTSFCEIDNSSEIFFVIASQSFIPLGPTTALAFPLLTTMARQLSDCAKTRRLQITPGDTTRFLVKIPAAAAGTSETINAKSLMFFALIPQLSPTALKPGTAGLRFFESFRVCESLYLFGNLLYGNLQELISLKSIVV
jgi:hypothetical protein